MGRRIAKTIEGQTTYFLYTDEGLIAELNQQGKLTKAYGWLADTSYSTSPLWQAEPQAGETTISDLKQAQFHTLTTDHLGTVQMATNEAGEVTWRAQSEAFGKTMLDEKNQITMNLRFPGQYFDEETGTHYNYFRDYKPNNGEVYPEGSDWIEGGINTYAYVNCNPFRYYDVYGLDYKWGKLGQGKPNPIKGDIGKALWEILEDMGINDILVNNCVADCIKKYRFSLELVIPAAATSSYPKKMLPPFRVVNPDQRLTTIPSSLVHPLKKGPVKRFIRDSGRGMSRVGTPALIFERFYDLGTIIRCTWICKSGDQCL